MNWIASHDHSQTARRDPGAGCVLWAGGVVGGCVVSRDSGAPQADGLSQAEPEVSALRASIPSAYELGQKCADSITPDQFGPLIKRLSDDVYERLLITVENYLCDNSQYNITSRISNAEDRAKRAETELMEIDHMLGRAYDGATRAQRILDIHTRLNRALNTIAAQAIEARRAETGTGSVHESAVAESDAP